MMLRKLTLLCASVLACARGSGSSVGNVQPAPSPASTDASGDITSQIRSIDEECRDVTSRASRTEGSSREIGGLELEPLGMLDGRIRLATGIVTVGENRIQLDMCYRHDGSLAKATKVFDAMEHSMGERNRQLEASVVRYFDPEGTLLLITGRKKLSEVQSGTVLEEGPVTEQELAPDAESILASFDREATLVMQAAQLGPSRERGESTEAPRPMP